MTVAALLLGVLNCLVLALVLVLIGAILAWVLGALGWPLPWNVQRLYLLVVALITLICFVSLLVGTPMVHIIGRAAVTTLAAKIAGSASRLPAFGQACRDSPRLTSPRLVPPSRALPIKILTHAVGGSQCR